MVIFSESYHYSLIIATPSHPILPLNKFRKGLREPLCGP
jgi:hypothetical protein